MSDDFSAVQPVSIGARLKAWREELDAEDAAMRVSGGWGRSYYGGDFADLLGYAERMHGALREYGDALRLLRAINDEWNGMDDDPPDGWERKHDQATRECRRTLGALESLALEIAGEKT